jgi:small-conductance mechanosensitive channel
VGLGFGLQKTASNYISGFIILLDRSVRIGDVVTVDNKYGEITQITNRYTVVKSLDGTEAIIPNETMITSTVVNHSFTTRDVRMNLAVQISYASSLEQAMMIMKRVALSHPRVLQQPVPEVFLKEFGDNGLLLDLVVWISDPEQGQLNLRSALNLDIWREFQAAGIEIPYPRRDIRVVDFAANAVIPSS